MKQYLLGGLLAGALAACGGPGATTDADPAHAAVTAYLKPTLNDPASYEPARWGRAAGFTRRDSVKAVLAPIMARPGYGEAQGGFVDKMLASAAFQDTTRLGTRLPHAWRNKNASAALVLDSAQFVVYKGGQVQRL